MRRQFRRPDSPLHLSHTLREPLKALSDSRFVIKSGRRCNFSLTGTLRLDHFKSQDGKSPQYKVPHWLSAMSVCLYREPGVHADVALESALRAGPGILHALKRRGQGSCMSPTTHDSQLTISLWSSWNATDNYL